MKPISLYELGQQYLDLLEMEIETEEDANAYTALMAQLDGAIQDKLENCALVVQSLKWSAKCAKEEADRLQKRAQAFERKAEHLQEYMQEQMELTTTDKIKTPRVSVWIQNNPPRVVIDDETRVPVDCMTVPAPYPNRSLISDKLKAGEVLEWARLEQSRGIRIR